MSELMRERREIQVEVDDVTYTIESGQTLQRLASEPEMNIVFGCFSGRCGFCKVEILSGGANLNPITDLEEVYFANGRNSHKERLACQCAPTGAVSISTDV